MASVTERNMADVMGEVGGGCYTWHTKLLADFFNIANNVIFHVFHFPETMPLDVF